MCQYLHYGLALCTGLLQMATQVGSGACTGLHVFPYAMWGASQGARTRAASAKGSV